jgi:hypothetical protein
MLLHLDRHCPVARLESQLGRRDQEDPVGRQVGHDLVGRTLLGQGVPPDELPGRELVAVLGLVLVLGLHAEDVVDDVDLDLVGPVVVRVEADLEGLVVVANLDGLESI